MRATDFQFSSEGGGACRRDRIEVLMASLCKLANTKLGNCSSEIIRNRSFLITHHPKSMISHAESTLFHANYDFSSEITRTPWFLLRNHPNSVISHREWPDIGDFSSEITRNRWHLIRNHLKSVIPHAKSPVSHWKWWVLIGNQACKVPLQACNPPRKRRAKLAKSLCKLANTELGDCSSEITRNR